MSPSKLTNWKPSNSKTGEDTTKSAGKRKRSNSPTVQDQQRCHEDRTNAQDGGCSTAAGNHGSSDVLSSHQLRKFADQFDQLKLRLEEKEGQAATAKASLADEEKRHKATSSELQKCWDTISSQKSGLADVKLKLESQAKSLKKVEVDFSKELEHSQGWQDNYSKLQANVKRLLPEYDQMEKDIETLSKHSKGLTKSNAEAEKQIEEFQKRVHDAFQAVLSSTRAHQAVKTGSTRTVAEASAERQEIEKVLKRRSADADKAKSLRNEISKVEAGPYSSS